MAITYDRYAKFAEHLLSEYKDRITGANVEVVYEHEPTELFMVGRLVSELAVATSRNRDSSICSIGIDFYLREEDLPFAELEIIPGGELYYRVFPSLDEQKQSFYRSWERAVRLGEPDSQENVVAASLERWSEDVLPVYAKKHIQNLRLKAKLRDIYDTKRQYGMTDFRQALDPYIDALGEEIQADSRFYHIIRERCRAVDLQDEATWEKFIRTRSEEYLRPIWNFAVSCEIRPHTAGLLRVSVLFTNTSPVGGVTRDYRINTIFNSSLEIRLDGATFSPIAMEYFADDYKYDRTQLAIGRNCGVEVDSNSPIVVRTTHLPVYRQYRLRTRDHVTANLDELIKDPVSGLTEIIRAMEREVAEWRAYGKQLLPRLSPKGQDQLASEISGFEEEILRFANGIRLIRDYEAIRLAFTQMNMTFRNSAKQFEAWYLFQIVFIVSMIADVCASEYGEDEMGEMSQPDKADVLHFPTGGGKTEAFLGCVVFTLFFDRIRGKSDGVSAIIKYPLRLLSIQQVERIGDILAEAELIRRDCALTKDGKPFSLGYFVGEANTPNKIQPELAKRLQDSSQETLDGDYRVLEKCPFCQQKEVHVHYDEITHRLVHRCHTPQCCSGGDLPFYMVDTEIYRYLPSVIVSTIDKFALIGVQASFRNILGEVRTLCPRHGYSSRLRCTERICDVPMELHEVVSLKDGAPTLMIQDELHLVRESLGAYDAHYETLLELFYQELNSSTKNLKVIGATATITGYQEQFYHLYMKEGVVFPAPAPYLDRSFYAEVNKNQLGRLILGYAPYGQAVVSSMGKSMKHMREILWEQYQNIDEMVEFLGLDSREEALEILANYWVFIQYNTVKKDGNLVIGNIESQANIELIDREVQPFDIRRMTGDDSFQDVRRTLEEIGSAAGSLAGPNLICATSMISHGVDENRFNVMYFFGMPNNTAEYLQAYSRVGRKYPGIVIVVMRVPREKDRSYLKNFVSFHEFKDILIEPVPINRWASKAIDRSFPGVLSGILINYFDLELQYVHGHIYGMRSLQKAIQAGDIPRARVKQLVKAAYKAEVDIFGRAYARKIDRLVDEFYARIVAEDFTQEPYCYISRGLERLGLGHPMRSLRDTDIPVKIELV